MTKSAAIAVVALLSVSTTRVYADATMTLAADDAVYFGLASGVALPAGSAVYMGTFSISDGAISALESGGVVSQANYNTLVSAFVPLNGAFSGSAVTGGGPLGFIGNNALGDAGAITYGYTGSNAGFANGNIYIMVVDTATTAGASQVGVFRGDSTWTYPADMVGGSVSIDTDSALTSPLIGAYAASLNAAANGYAYDVDSGNNYGTISALELASIGSSPPPAPVAGFTANPTNGAAPLDVIFTDGSTGTITNHSWTFGDGDTSTLSSPSHTYTNAGTFSVALTVSGPGGSSTTNLVNLITTINAPPVAGFTANPTNGAAPLDVIFTDASTGTITDHLWTFGDSGTSTSSSPSHTYTSAGTFSVSLIVSGPLGTSTNTQSNLITATNAPPVADFTASPTNGATPLHVTFTDTSTGTITNHSWTFGDGGTSTSSSPSHTYTNAGSFSVALTVSGPAGSSTTNRVNLITATNGAPPAVSIVRPGAGMLYPATFTNQTITIVAAASDSDGISKIEFFRDGTNKLGETTSNPGTNLWNGPTLGLHTLRAVAHDTLSASNTSATITITIGAKNSPLGDWEVTIGGADKGVEFVTFGDDFSASGYDIRLKKFGENDVAGTWGFDAKGRLTGLPGSFIEELGSATNWTGTLAGTAKSLKSLSASVATANVGVFRWKGLPATEFPDLSGTWTGVVTIVKAPTSVSYAIRTNANDSVVFDVTTSSNTNAVIGKLIATSRDVVYGCVAVGGTNITMSGKFSAKKLPMTMTFKGATTNTPAAKVSIQLFR